MNNRNVIENIKKKVYRKLNNILNESDFNYHYTAKDIDGNGIPYASDNKHMMKGRDTGHFGSGTYFASYKHNGDYKGDKNNLNPSFIKIRNGLYRVDMDFYKNLYRVNSKQEGDLLYTTLRCLNGIYNNVSDGNFNNAQLYQKIRNNIGYLDLDNISYSELIKMIKEYENGGYNQSFSTYFMERNGYNGVNVSGISFYDNTKHGSVIYDLNNVDIRNVSPKQDKKNMPYLYIDDNNPYSDTLGKTEYNDNERDYIRGRYINGIYDMDMNKQSRYVRNALDNDNFFDYEVLSRFPDNVIKIYFKKLYNKKTFGHWYSNLNDLLKYYNEYIYLILEHKLLYYVNVPYSENYSVIRELLNSFWRFYNEEDIDEKKEFIKEIYSNLKRPLNRKEEEYINSFLEP